MTLRGRQWLPVGLFVLGLVINYFDRITLSIGNTQIRSELGLSIGQMGILLSAFSWAYAASQLPAGVLVDKVGPRRLLAAAVFCWSTAQLTAGFVFSLAPFIASRMALGVFEAPTAPTQARMIANWFDRAHRGLPMGVANVGSSLGAVLSPPILTWIMLVWGWRTMFIVMGVVGMAFSLLWFLLYRDPEDAPLSDADRARTGIDVATHRDPVRMAEWARLFRSRVTWGLVLGNFGAIYVTWLFIAWLPGYLVMQQHVSLMRTGFYAAIPQFFGVLGALTGGWVCDRCAAWGMGLVNSRRVPLICGLIGSAVFTLPVALTHDTGLALTCIALAVFCSNVTSSAAWTLVTAVAPERYMASVGSMQNCGGYFGAAVAPIVTGYIVEGTGGFAPAFVVGSAMATFAALCYALLVTRPVLQTDLQYS